MPESSYIVITDLDGSSNGRRFELEVERGNQLQYRVVRSGEIIEKEFTFEGGMGETVCKHFGACPDHYFSDFDNSDGTLRLPPLVTTAISNEDVAYTPVTFWEEFDADGDRAVYVCFRDTSTTPDVLIRKIRVSDDTVVDSETSVAAADQTVPVLGKTITYKGATYVPDGGFSGSNVLRKLATVGDISASTADTWENADASVFASSCDIVQDDSTTKFIRATAGTYLTAENEPKTSANYSSAFQVGDQDNTAGITWTVAGGDGLIYFSTASGLYTGDGKGNAFPVIPLERELVNKPPASYDDIQGHMAASVGEAILWPGTRGLVRFIVAPKRQKLAGPDAIRGYRAVANVSNIPIRLRHYAVVTKQENVYAIYKPTGFANTANVHILYGVYEDGEITWRNLITRALDIIGLFIDSDDRLWWVEDPQDPATIPGVATGDFLYCQLAADGSPRTALGSNRGAASNTYEHLFSEILYDQQVQLRYMRVETESFDSTTSLQLKINRDGGSSNSIGSAITSDDYHQITFTAGTTDTARRARMRFTLDTNGSYTPSSKDPRILRALLGVRSPDIYRAVITDSTIDSARTNRKILRQRKGGGMVQVTESWSGTQYRAEVFAMSDLETREDEGNLRYRSEIMIRRWDVES